MEQLNSLILRNAFVCINEDFLIDETTNYQSYFLGLYSK